MAEFYWISCAVSNTSDDAENRQQVGTFILVSCGSRQEGLLYIQVFWDVTPCYECVVSDISKVSSIHYVALCIETSGSAGPPTPSNTSEEFNCQQPRCDNLKSQYGFFRWPFLSILLLHSVNRIAMPYAGHAITKHYNSIMFCFWRNSPPNWARASSSTRFLDLSQRRTTVGGTSLDEWLVRRRDLYLATHNTHNRHASMPLVGLESATPAGERPQTYAFDRAAIGCGHAIFLLSAV
jgi:hypothetical protein